jgi:hypothetical protein
VTYINMPCTYSDRDRDRHRAHPLEQNLYMWEDPKPESELMYCQRDKPGRSTVTIETQGYLD